MIDLKPYVVLSKMMILATVDEYGIPYTSNVYFKYDKSFNFYFRSKIFREHSKHVIANSKSAWSIINTEKYTRTDSNKKGLQFQGSTFILKGTDAEYASKNIFGKELSIAQIQESGQHIFKCIPKKVKIWDEELYSGNGKIILLGG